MSNIFFIQTLRLSIRSFIRNGSLVFLAICAVVCIQLILLGGLFGKTLFSYGLHALEKRVDIRLSLVIGTSNAAQHDLVSRLQSIPHVTEIQSVSAESMYKAFQSRHATDFLTLQALKELNSNPFGPELILHLDKPSAQSEFLALLKSGDALSKEQQASIEDVDAIHNDVLVARLSAFSQTALGVGAVTSAVILIIALISLSVVSRMFLNQYTLDMAVMRTFGISESYIGAWLSATYTLCVILSTVASVLLGSVFTRQFDNFLGSFGAGAMMATWYMNNIFAIIGFLLCTALAVIHTMVFFFLLKKRM